MQKQTLCLKSMLSADDYLQVENIHDQLFATYHSMPKIKGNNQKFYMLNVWQVITDLNLLCSHKSDKDYLFNLLDLKLIIIKLNAIADQIKFSPFVSEITLYSQAKDSALILLAILEALLNQESTKPGK